MHVELELKRKLLWNDAELRAQHSAPHDPTGVQSKAKSDAASAAALLRTPDEELYRAERTSLDMVVANLLQHHPGYLIFSDDRRNVVTLPGVHTVGERGWVCAHVCC